MKNGLFCTAIIMVLLFVSLSELLAQEQESSQMKSAAEVIANFVKENGSVAAKDKFKELVALKDVEYSFKESEFLSLGYELLRSGKTLDAIEVFKMTAEVFPDSYNVYMSLGRAYRMIGDLDQDRKSVEKAFALQNRDLLAEFLKKNKDTLAKTADEVIEKHLEAIGGRESLEKIKTMVITYTGLDSIDQETLITRYYKSPHFIRQDIAATGASIATDGDKVWRITSGKWEELSNSNWAYMPDINEDFIDYSARGITYRLLGVEAIDRRIYYHLVKKYADEEKRDFYFSADSGLFRMERRDFGVGKDIKSYWDYRHHEGILIPHLFVVILDVGFGQTHGGILKEIKINVPLEDSLFRILEQNESRSIIDDFPVLKGPYLGQKPPGMTPEVFAPGIITTEISEGCSGWGNDMEYFVFQRWIDGKPLLYIMNQNNGVWSAPESLPIVDKYQAGDFTIAPDGKTMVFASRIFIDEIGSEGEGANIWSVEKTDTGWTEPKHIGGRINTKYHESYPCLTVNGNLYFFSRRPGGYGDSDLYLSEFVEGEYQAPVNLGPKLNTEYHEWDTYTAPDESYMIYCSTKPGGLGEDDIYVTFKQSDGSWSDPVHMGKEINTDKSENRPYVSPDGKYIFYASTKRGNRDIYWVDAKIIDELKPGKLLQD